MTGAADETMAEAGAVQVLDAAAAAFSRAETLRLLAKLDEAVAAYDAALALRPDHAEAWCRRGLALHELGAFEDAIDSYDAALHLRPDFAEAHNNRSASLRSVGRCEEALAAAEHALQADPRYARAYNSRGNALRALGRADEALWNYERAIEAFPNYGRLRFNRALCLLAAGRFAEGWREYEWRWTMPEMQARLRNFGRPLWLGRENLAGRTVLLHAEQGLGDVLQFCRYVPLVAAAGARVVLGVPPALTTLMHSLDGPSLVVDRPERLPGFDLQAPLMSLPLAFGTTLETVPRRVPYLAPPAAQARAWGARLGAERVGPRRRLRVGLAWSGNPHHGDDRNRSMALRDLAPLLALPAAFYCLQRTLRPDDVPDFALHPELRFFGPALTEFADTAALMAQMDLVISVDTAVLHLAGALGRPAWGLLPFAPDWRWLTGRADTPWYPTMTLVRQSRPGAWEEVVATVAARLQPLCAESPRPW